MEGNLDSNGSTTGHILELYNGRDK